MNTKDAIKMVRAIIDGMALENPSGQVNLAAMLVTSLAALGVLKLDDQATDANGATAYAALRPEVDGVYILRRDDTLIKWTFRNGLWRSYKTDYTHEYSDGGVRRSVTITAMTPEQAASLGFRIEWLVEPAPAGASNARVEPPAEHTDNLYHWIDQNGVKVVRHWCGGQWMSFTGEKTSVTEATTRGWVYLGPCLTPDEQAPAIASDRERDLLRTIERLALRVSDLSITLRGAADDCERAYGSLPIDAPPGPPTALVARMRAAADARSDQQPRGS